MIELSEPFFLYFFLGVRQHLWTPKCTVIHSDCGCGLISCRYVDQLPNVDCHIVVYDTDACLIRGLF